MNRKNLPLQLVGTMLMLSNIANAESAPRYYVCQSVPELYKERSAELQALVNADQEDRAGNVMKPGAEFRDRERRKRVGEIFGEGCFKEARDFSAAALVYQHGDVPEHFFQTFLWSKRAVELGDESQRELIAKGIDRYLVNINHKQLFGTQAWKFNVADKCWCLRAVETTFPDSTRKEYLHKTLSDQFKWVDSLNEGYGCGPAKICKEDQNIKETPRGFVPGFW